MSLREIRLLMGTKKFEQALAALERLLKRHSECADLWILRGDLIQLLDAEDGPPLNEAAASYSKALRLNPNCLETIEGLAHYYDAVDHNPIKARRYAERYIQRATKSISEMERIIADTL